VRLKRVLHVLNLTSCICCLVISAQILVYGSIVIVEPNLYVVAVEVVLASTTIVLNIREVLNGFRASPSSSR